MTISKEEWESLIRRVEKLEGKTSFSLEEMKEAMREALAGKGKGARMTGEYVTKREDSLKSRCSRNFFSSAHQRLVKA